MVFAKKQPKIEAQCQAAAPEAHTPFIGVTGALVVTVVMNRDGISFTCSTYGFFRLFPAVFQICARFFLENGKSCLFSPPQ